MSAILLTIISTVIVGAILVLILNLLFSSKPDEEVLEYNKRREQEDSITTESVHKDNDLPQSTPNEEFYVTQDVNDLNDNQYKAPDVIVEEITKNVMNEVNKVFENSRNEKPFPNEEVNDLLPSVENEIIDEDLYEKQVINESELKDDFWDKNETQNLKHFNKSRPKKPKSRLSVKVVFNKDSDEKSDANEDNLMNKEEELVDELFDNLDSGANSKSDDLMDFEEVSELDKQSADNQTEGIDLMKDSFEEISTGDYKKFDEFSDYFRTESQKQEITRNVTQMSSVKTFDITLNSDHQLNDKVIDELLTSFGETKHVKVSEEVSEENFSQTRDYESIEVRKRDKTEVISTRTEENVSHTKVFTERSLSSSSLSKMSLEDINTTLRSSKSRFSETIDNVTKPLLSSPTLYRKHTSREECLSSECEEQTDDCVNESPKRTAVPMFGSHQKLLISEMKNKDFRRSLRPVADKKDSEQ